MSKDSIDKMFDEILGPQTPSESVALPSKKIKPPVKLPRPSLYDDAARILSEPTDHFFSALDLLRSPKYLNQAYDCLGHWDYKKSVWINQNGTTVTLDELRTEMVRRCVELNVDVELVEAFGRSVLSIAESKEFHRLPFEDQMQRFRSGESL